MKTVADRCETRCENRCKTCETSETRSFSPNNEYVVETQGYVENVETV